MLEPDPKMVLGALRQKDTLRIFKGFKIKSISLDYIDRDSEIWIECINEFSFRIGMTLAVKVDPAKTLEYIKKDEHELNAQWKGKYIEEFLNHISTSLVRITYWSIDLSLNGHQFVVYEYSWYEERHR